MIYLKFMIDNPWFKPCAEFKSKNYYGRDIKLTENKNFEIQISRFEASDLLNLIIDLRWWGQDHAGPEFDISMFGFMFNVKIYDVRHWCYEAHRWQTGAESQLEMSEYDLENTHKDNKS
jgi:hypothetical protein